MKITCVLIAVLAAIVLVAADSGFYSPRAFYRIDSSGNRGRVHFISPNIQRRLRRQVVGGSSSSSSSVSGGFGAPTYFSTSGSTYSSPGVGLTSRFGDDVPVSGSYHTSSGYLGSDGRIHYTTNQGGPILG